MLLFKLRDLRNQIDLLAKNERKLVFLFLKYFKYSA